ncbi:MAG: hypothetical protein HC879_08735 [Leptolyngbyaceae cyanobacterium SL_5_9]|nr:hypothetical protein [Leptolyngbyaceae cyanobacterium SM1_4_3]NJN57570.1 hypothetical protein [Leptolyngbyaceae cyanobacterium SL_5_9]NJO75339.1 hypothetical protein [Leptolyngbyaceae cyanobacterium RM1_406_9]
MINGAIAQPFNPPMIQEEISQDSNNQPRPYSVWSDLRAMKFLGQVQQEMRSLKSSNARLQFWLSVTVMLLGGTMVAIAVALAITYTQLQQLRQQIQSLPTSNLNQTSYLTSSTSNLTPQISHHV